MTANHGAKIALSWLETSRAQRIVWLLEELNLSYTLQTFKRIDRRAPPEMKEIHALGKSPIVTVEYPRFSSNKGESSPRVVLAESAAIMEYLVENFQGERLMPPRWGSLDSKLEVRIESEAWTRYRFFMHYAEGSLMPLLATQILMDAVKEAPVPFFIKPVTKMIAGKVSNEYLEGNYKTHFGFLESQLATSLDGGEFLCGKDLTTADMLISFPVLIALEQGIITKEQYPRLVAYAGRLQAIESYKRAIQKVEDAEGVAYKLV